jgi:hypothetical protein
MSWFSKLFRKRDPYLDAIFLLLSEFRSVDEQLARRTLSEIGSAVYRDPQRLRTFGLGVLCQR